MTKLILENHSNSQDNERLKVIECIRSALIGFNLDKVPGARIEPVVFSITGDNGIVGGLVGRIAWDWLHIELLWLDEALRGMQYGSRLLNEAENLARNMGCAGVFLDTFGFQAPEFYQQHGYEIFGQIDNQPRGNVRYFLKKTFAEETDWQ